MKHSATVFLKCVIVLTAILALIGLLRFPQTEGRAAHLDLLSIYANPFILYIYIGSIPFFGGLYQAFKLLGLIEDNKAFSPRAIIALRNIKFASLSLIGFITLAELYIRFAAHGDDSAGPTMLGIIVCLVVGVIATVAAVFQKLFQNAVDLKSENDLTV